MSAVDALAPGLESDDGACVRWELRHDRYSDRRTRRPLGDAFVVYANYRLRASCTSREAAFAAFRLLSGKAAGEPTAGTSPDPGAGHEEP